MAIGKAIKTVLDKKNMTQLQLAEITGISQTSLSLLINDITSPRKITIKKIAKALKISPNVLYMLSIEREDVPAKNRPVYDTIWGGLETTLTNLFLG